MLSICINIINYSLEFFEVYMTLKRKNFSKLSDALAGVAQWIER